MNAIVFSIFFKAICAAACHFLGWCCRQEGCPDGVCEPAIEKLESLEVSAPSAHPAKVTSFGANFNWSALNEIVENVMNLLASVRKFFGESSDDIVVR